MTTIFRPFLSRVVPGIVPAFLILSLSTGRAQSPPDSSVVDMLNNAYSAMGKNPAEAERLFRRVTVMQPTNITAWRELGYLHLGAGNLDSALADFQQSEALRSSDTIRLQIGYILASQRRESDAKQLFASLAQSSDPEISRKASDQLVLLESNERGSRYWLRVYADPYYDTRWNTSFLHLNVQEGYDLTDDRTLSAYGVLSLSTDSRSLAESVPEIISDNTVLLGAGLRLKPFYGASAIIQEGVAADLSGGRTSTKFHDDFRAVAYYGNGLYADFKVHDELRMPLYPFVDVYSSFGYYSRYKNAIGYLQGKGGTRLVEVGHTAFDLYALGDYVWDVELDYYNNILEGGFGARLIPSVDLDLHLVAEWRRGKYLDVSDTARNLRASRYDEYYSAWRFMVVFERTF